MIFSKHHRYLWRCTYRPKISPIWVGHGLRFSQLVPRTTLITCDPFSHLLWPRCHLKQWGIYSLSRNSIPFVVGSLLYVESPFLRIKIAISKPYCWLDVPASLNSRNRQQRRVVEYHHHHLSKSHMIVSINFRDCWKFKNIKQPMHKCLKWHVPLLQVFHRTNHPPFLIKEKKI